MFEFRGGQSEKSLREHDPDFGGTSKFQRIGSGPTFEEVQDSDALEALDSLASDAPLIDPPFKRTSYSRKKRMPSKGQIELTFSTRKPAKKKAASKKISLSVSAAKKKMPARKRRYTRPKYFEGKALGRRYSVANEITRAQFGYSWKDATPAQREQRRLHRYYDRGLYTGRGGFWGDLWGGMKRGWGMFKKPLLDAGGIVASNYGQGNTYNALRAASGIGAINVATNDLIQTGPEGDVMTIPSFSPISDTGEVTMSHREYIGNVYAPEVAVGSGSNFSAQHYPLNPGMEASFKWLSQIAANYEEYEFGQLMFTFKSTVSEFQTTNGVVGQILGCTQYNSSAPPFDSKEEMITYHGCVTAKTNNNFMKGVECDPAKLAGAPGKYVRYQGLDFGQDLKDYDLGRFTVATVDCPHTLSNQMIGELWVSYTVRLRRPKLVVGRGLTITQDLYAVKTIQGAEKTIMVPTAAGTMAGHDPCFIFSLDPSELLEAPQNNIGTKLERVAAATVTPVHKLLFIQAQVVGAFGFTPEGDYLKITFPAQYSGDVAIELTCRGSDDVTSCCFLSGYAEGNVEAITDMLTGDISNRKVPPLFTNADVKNMHSCVKTSGGATFPVGLPTVSLGGCHCSILIHVRIRQSVGGENNCVYLNGDFVIGAPPLSPVINVVNASLTIRERNSGFDDHLSGRPDWVNVQNGVQQILPDSP